MTKKAGHHKILIIRFSSIGDIVLTTPLVSAVKKMQPSADLDYLTLSEYREILAENLHINSLYCLDRDKGLSGLIKMALLLRRNRYTHVIDLHRSLRSLVVRIFTGGSRSVFGKRYIKRFLLIHFGINLYRKPLSVVYRYFNAAGLPGSWNDESTGLWIGSGDIERLAKKIKNIIEFDISVKKADSKSVKLEKDSFEKKGGTVISLMPFAKWSTKEWGDENFVDLGQRIVRETDAQVFILGGHEDRERAERIAGGIGSGAISCAGKFSLTETCAALSVSDLLVTNDTGVMHLGGAVSVPVIAIFGSTTEELGFFPYNTSGEVLQAAVSCRPCTSKGLNSCPKKHFACMNDISVEDVYQAVRRYL